jgi:hypothetical protein
MAAAKKSAASRKRKMERSIEVAKDNTEAAGTDTRQAMG